MTPTSICILGAGFVGLTTATVFAQQGHQVAVVDVSAERCEALLRGEVPFHEPGLTDALCAELSSGRLAVATDAHKAMVAADYVFLCVGTPAAADGSADLTYIKAAAAEVGRAVRDATKLKIVVVKSTVPPGTLQTVVVPEVERESGRSIGNGWGAAFNPEFLKEGAALKDAREPDRVVVGATDPVTENAMGVLYRGAKCPLIVVTPHAAEMIKYASNAMLATRIAATNEIGNICQRIGVNVDEVMQAVGHDARIGPLFLKAGVGFGGSCFPKDLKALRAIAAKLGVDVPIMDATLKNNDAQPLRAVDLLSEAIGGLFGRKVALLGLAFKPDTSDVRETRALPIYNALIASGADVTCYDPQAGSEFAALAAGAKIADSPADALMGVDACIIQTEWPTFREIKPSMLPPVVVDGRRHLDRDALEAAGIHYIGVGDGRVSNGGR